MLDIGSGGGLPGIPLAIAHPGTDVILVESRKRRIECLRAFIGEMALPNATLLAGRAEEFSELHGAMPLVTAFGVGPPVAVVDIVEPFLDESGVGILSCAAAIDKETWAGILLRSAMLGLRVSHERDALTGPRSVLLLSRM